MAKIIEGIDYSRGDIVQFTIEKNIITNYKQLDTIDYSSFEWIAPGMFDLHINGYGGIDFNDPNLTGADLHILREKLNKIGCSVILITLITNDCAQIEAQLKRIHQIKKSDPILDEFILGYHVEGPFISPNDGPRGAHNVKFVCAPNLEWILKWNQAVEGALKIVTISPEWLTDFTIVSEIKRHGIIVSIGHTDASKQQVQQAIEFGASMATHLGNGSSQLQDRHHSSYWNLLSDDRVMACFIADGQHLPQPVLTTFTNAKKKKCIIVSDSSSSGGMPPGDYETFIGGRVTISKNNRLHLTDTPEILAGSACTILDCVNTMVNYGILTQAEAWNAASFVPRNFIDSNYNSFFRVGDKADFVLFEKNIKGLRVNKMYNSMVEF